MGVFDRWKWRQNNSQKESFKLAICKQKALLKIVSYQKILNDL